MSENEMIASSVLELLRRFGHCFTRPGYENFAKLVAGWILCHGRHTISRVIQAADQDGGKQKRHHSAFYRFFSRARWAPDELGHTVFKIAKRWLPPVIIMLVDDTLAHKSGPHIFAGAMHHDAQRSTYGRGSQQGRKVVFSFGLNFVVLSLWVPIPWIPSGGMALPILFRLYRSKKRCPTQDYRKRTTLAKEMIYTVMGWEKRGQAFHIVGDAEYSCKTLALDLPPNVFFTGPMPLKAAVYDRHVKYSGKGRKPKKGRRLLSPKQLAEVNTVKWKKRTVPIYGKNVTMLVKTQKCLWYAVAGQRRGIMVLTRDPSGRLDDRAYFCTNTALSTEEIIVTFSRRWEIEVAFRNAKQHLGLEDPQNGWWRRLSGTKAPPIKPGPNPKGTIGRHAVQRTFPFAFIVYDLVIFWYLSNGNPEKDVDAVKKAAPWYLHKESPSFLDMLVAVRSELWAERLSRHPLLRRVAVNVHAVFSRWLLAS